MPGTLLATKVYIPVLGANLVDRLHLVARLDEGLRRGCRLISFVLSLVLIPAAGPKSPQEVVA